MLATDEKRLRWWGIDMQARWRRRLAVVAGYVGFVVVMGVTLDSTSDQHPVRAVLGMVVLTMIWKWASIFRGNGLVKSFEEPPVYRGRMFVNGLDEWARYRYGVKNFEAVSEEQQAELLKRYRFGTFLLPAKDSAKLLDERERGERDSATRWALQKIAMWVGIPVGTYVSRAARHARINPMEIVANFWILSLMAQTLPQARVLWTEPDPREIGGEMELVEVGD